MNNILLISEDTLKTYSNLNDNTFGKWILPAIKESQEMGLMPIIGECLYNKICELVADGSINDILFTAYKDLLDDKIQPYLIYITLSNIIPIIIAKMANIGTVLTNDEHVINLTQGESDLLKTYYSERCDFYTKRLQDFIKNNQSAFPEISCGCGNMQPNLESSENSVGVWLGGSRGKKIGDNKCACSSTEVTCADYQSGFTDGVEFQKRKLQITAVTENGRYISEDGFKEIAVDVPAPEPSLEVLSVTENGDYLPSAGYDGFSLVEVAVPTGHTDEELQEAYQDGVVDGTDMQKARLSAITLTQNGDYSRENGYSAVTVNVPQTGHTDEEMQQQYQSGYTSGYTSGSTDGFNSGYTSGETHQKSLLSALTITQNGNYNREDGYSAITVNVSGQSATLATTAVTANGEYAAPQGYDGFSSFEVNVPQTGYTQQDLDNAYASGETHQKSLMTSTAVTENGVYTRSNGFSAITVNVPQTGYSEGYQSGYTDGYNDAYNLLGSIEVTPSYNNIHYNDTAITLTAVSNIPWSISEYPEWAVPNVQSGSGTTTINVSLPVNMGDERRGNIVFDSLSGSISSSVYIRQGYQPTPPPTPSGQTEYLTLNIKSNGSIKWENYYYGTDTGRTVQYSKNGGSWISITSDKESSAPSISVSNGDVLRFKGNNGAYASHGKFTTNVSFTVSGNIMSLIHGDVFSGDTKLYNWNVFSYMFADCTGLTDASNLVLPATALTNYCYEAMFKGCTSLTKAPELPAPFADDGCYQYMFMGCTHLNYIKCLIINPQAQNFTARWVEGVSSTGTFVKNSTMYSNWDRGDTGIPNNWTVIDNS